jgi:hypothetical protein
MPRSSQMPAREIRREGASDVAHDYEKIKLLFDYTKYHIGIYTTLGTILIGVLGLHLGLNDKSPLQFCGLFIWVSIGFIAIAGMAGGIIASTLPESDSLPRFFALRTGPWGWKLLSGRAWTMVEHTAFWVGLIVGLTAFLIPELLGHTPTFCSVHIS